MRRKLLQAAAVVAAFVTFVPRPAAIAPQARARTGGSGGSLVMAADGPVQRSGRLLLPDTTAPECRDSLKAFADHPPVGPAGLPAPVRMDTLCGRYELRTDGSVATLPTEPHTWWVQPVSGGGWANVRDGHVVVVRDGRRAWRSAGNRFKQAELGAVVMGPPGVAFATYRGDRSSVFVAGPGQGERRITTTAEPMGWLRTGALLMDRWRDENVTLLVWHPGGPVEKLSEQVAASAIDRTTGTAVFVTRDLVLTRTDGDSTVPLLDLDALGYRPAPGGWGPSLFVLGDGRIVVCAPDRLSLLDPDGRLTWSGRFPLPKAGYGWMGAPPDTMVVDPSTGAVVFVRTSWRYTDGKRGWRGWEGIYSLSLTGTLTRLYGRRLYMVPCGHVARLSWHGGWALYSACEGRVVAVDVSGAHPPVDLTTVAVHLPHSSRYRKIPLEDARWA